MPDLSTRRHPTRRRARRRTPAVLVAALVLVIGACGGDATPGPSGSPSSGATGGASPTLLPQALVSLDPGASGDPRVDLCTRLATARERVAALLTVELRLTNRVALDIELGKVEAAFSELESTDLDAFGDELDEAMTRLGYRLEEVELAVEDFRTNSRPQQAAPHVQTDAQAFADDLDAFARLARC